MAKLIKQNYKTKDGKVKIHCYRIMLSKKMIEDSNIKDTDELKISVIDGKIVIERA